MSTILQKRLAKNIAENLRSKKPKNKKELIISSGYSPTSASMSSHVIMNQKGVREELEVLGFSTYRAKEVLAGILSVPSVYEMVTPENQIRAAQEVFKVMGAYAPEKSINVTVEIEPTDELIALAEKLNA